LLIQQVASVPLLVLTTTRPGYCPAWLDRPYVTQLALQPLDPDASRRVVHGVLAPRTLTPALEQQLLAKAQGNPFFLEELAHMVREQEEPQAFLAVPETIQAVLTARLDRLPAVEKRLAQVAAVIGTDVTIPLLQAITALPEEAIGRGLAHLECMEFLFPRGTVPPLMYTFKHVLTQEVVYLSVPLSTRRQDHYLAAQALEKHSPHLATTQPEVLAQHYTAAGRSAQAVVYWQRAGQRAVARSAARETVACFEHALQSLRALPETPDTLALAIDLRFALRSVLVPLQERGRILDTLREAEALATVLADQPRMGWVYAYMAEHFRMAGDPDQAIASGQRALAIAETLGDIGLQVTPTIYVGQAYHDRGDYRKAVACFGRNVETLTGTLLSEHFGIVDLPAIHSRVWLVWSLAELGEFAAARALGDATVRIAEELGHLGSLIVAYLGVGHLSLRQGDVQNAIAVLERGLTLCQNGARPLGSVTFAARLGAAHVLAGHLTQALPLLEQAVAQTVEQSERAFQAVCLGEGYLLAGRMEPAGQCAAQALALSRTHKQRGTQAWALRLLGEIAAARERLDVEQAADYYQQALTLADELGMRPLLAHCQRGLGTLYARSSQWEKAHTTLSAAMALYNAMEMSFWLPEMESALNQVERRNSR
jgi:tetratricopeptide (TPR) repeat protein